MSADWTVGIETSGNAGSIALLREGEMHSERPFGESGRRHARTLIAELKGLLEDAGLTAREAGLVAVSIGPGSFTGLRVGVVCAKTWAYVTGCRLAAVETFAAVLEDWHGEARSVWVIDDALRGEVFVQRFERADESPWTASGGIRLLPFEDWARELRDDSAVTGPGLSRWSKELRECGVECVEGGASAGGVARHGRRLAAQGLFADPFHLAPLYVRRSAAEEKLEAPSAPGTILHE